MKSFLGGKFLSFKSLTVLQLYISLISSTTSKAFGYLVVKNAGKCQALCSRQIWEQSKCLRQKYFNAERVTPICYGCWEHSWKNFKISRKAFLPHSRSSIDFHTPFQDSAKVHTPQLSCFACNFYENFDTMTCNLDTRSIKLE